MISRPKPKFKVSLEVPREFAFCRKIRHDLERARLLCELVRKRERLKRDSVANLEKQFLMRYHPVAAIGRDLLDKLQDVDKDQIFSQPVRSILLLYF